MLAAPLETVVTRGDDARMSAGINDIVRANGPRKFVPNCSSNPSSVTCRVGTDITPALLIKRSNFASLSIFAAKLCTDRKLARLSTSARTFACGTSCRIRSTASRPFASVLDARITSLPACASSSAVCQPSLPCSDGMSAGVHFVMLVFLSRKFFLLYQYECLRTHDRYTKKTSGEQLPPRAFQTRRSGRVP